MELTRPLVGGQFLLFDLQMSGFSPTTSSPPSFNPTSTTNNPHRISSNPQLKSPLFVSKRVQIISISRLGTYGTCILHLFVLLHPWSGGLLVLLYLSSNCSKYVTSSFLVLRNSRPPGKSFYILQESYIGALPPEKPP